MDCLDENTVAELFDGVLDPDTRSAVQEHLDACPDCRGLVGALGAELSEPLLETTPDTSAVASERGAAIGRYVVTETLGMGSMGIVYAAYDPQLDRKVALKCLGSGDPEDDESRTRWLDEAKSMARLSHPNVVAVHDVLERPEGLVIAMEYVAGQTLTRWLTGSRSVAERLHVFARAGEGLAAAHAVGLVHRDFKPDNVLVSDDGRVRVTDFGLATPSARATEDEDSRPSVGVVAGTPRYMAPEQHQGRPADPRSDQFGFCVALYEALYEQAPFEGDTVEALADSVVHGRLRPPPSPSTIPARVRRAVTRGLSTTPDDRYPSMTELLAALTPRRPAAGILVGAAALAVLGSAWVSGRDHAPDPCPRVDLDDVWNAERSATLGAALSSWPDGPEWSERIETRLDDYRDRWIATHQDACRATRVRRTQTEAMLEASMLCLEQHRREFGALVEVLGQLSNTAGPNAIDAVRRLRPPSDCVDLEPLDRSEPPPPLPEPLTEALARIKAMADAGDFSRAGPAALEAHADAGERSPRAAAATAVSLAWVYANTGHTQDAENVLHDALRDAELAGADDLRVEALALLTFVVGYSSARHDAGDRFGEQAHALATRLGAPPLQRARIWRYRGLVLHERGAFGDAAAAHEHALALVQAPAQREHPEHAKILVALANAHRALHRFDEAEAGYRRALALERDALGPRHPSLANALHGLGDVLAQQRRYEEALELYAEALAIHEHALGSKHPDVAGDRIAMARAQMILERFDAARQNLDTASSIFESAGLHDHPRRATTLAFLGELFSRQGRHEDAVQATRSAIDIRRRVTPNNPDLASDLHNLGTELLILERPENALPFLDESIALAKARLGPEHDIIALAQCQRGRALLQLERSEDAIEALERALEIWGDDAPEVRAGHRFTARIRLARALWSEVERRPRALELTAEAIRIYEPIATPDDASQLADARRWLADPR